MQPFSGACPCVLASTRPWKEFANLSLGRSDPRDLDLSCECSVKACPSFRMTDIIANASLSAFSPIFNYFSSFSESTEMWTDVSLRCSVLTQPQHLLRYLGQRCLPVGLNWRRGQCKAAWMKWETNEECTVGGISTLMLTYDCPDLKTWFTRWNVVRTVWMVRRIIHCL